MAKPKGKKIKIPIISGPIKKGKGPKYPGSFIGRITGRK